MCFEINKILLSLVVIAAANLKPFTCNPKTESDKIKAITMKRETPVVNRDNSITMIGGTYNVYYYSDLQMYKFNYRFDSISNNELILQEYRSYYFTFHKDSAYGYRFIVKPDIKSPNNMRLPKDSVLKFNVFESITYDTLINLRPDSIYSERGSTLKIYKNPPTGDSVPKPEKFDLYFYYSKELADIPETFSKKMDNEKGKKLVKILVKASGGYYKEFNMTFQPRQHVLEMKELEIENKDEIMHYFKSYKQQKL